MITTTRESAIQKSILDYLQLQENMGKCYFIRNNSFSGRLKRWNGTEGVIRNGKKGTPDIIICLNGRYVALEVKNETGTQSEHQKRAQEQIERAGGMYLLVRSVEEVVNLVTNSLNA